MEQVLINVENEQFWLPQKPLELSAGLLFKKKKKKKQKAPAFNMK